MDPPQHLLHHKGFLFLFILTLLNLLVLDLWLMKNFQLRANPSQPIQSSTTQLQPTAILDNQVCPKNCLTAIDDATSSLKLTTVITTAPATRTIVSQVSQPRSDGVKEFFIPLGTGSNTASDWTDVPGVKAEIDSTKYSNIQKVLFETSVHVPNANQVIEVRLYNETDKYIVANSEMLYPSGTTQNFRISEIKLGDGLKTYKVQMKTELKYTAILDQSRLHITTY